MDFDNIEMTMVRMMVDSVRKWMSPLKKLLHTLKKIRGARLLNASNSLECDDVGLKFQLKMLEFKDFMNQYLKCGKKKRAQQDKMIELLMMQGVRHFSLTKELAKISIPNNLVTS